MDIGNNYDIDIHKMTEKDFEGAAVLEKEIFLHGMSAKDFEEACVREENIYTVACVDGIVVAYCTITALYENADLCNIAVAKAFRHMHIGAVLLRETIELCRQREVKKIFLEVRESNFIAINFYKKMKFYEINIRKRYYKEPEEDAIIMCKDIE